MCAIGIALRAAVAAAWKLYYPKGGNIKTSPEYERVVKIYQQHCDNCKYCH